jgi:hypothetical protein
MLHLIGFLASEFRTIHVTRSFQTRSSSHTVAARSGCTKIPLAAGLVQMDETILILGVSGHASNRFAPLESSHT